MSIWKNIKGILSDTLQINLSGPKLIKSDSATLQLRDSAGSTATLDVNKVTGLALAESLSDAASKEFINELGVGNIFKQSDYSDNLQTTINAASDGDIILLNKGETDIGDNIITLSKRLTFIGHGTGLEGTTITSSHYSSTDPIFQLTVDSSGETQQKRLSFINMTIDGKGTVGCGIKGSATTIEHATFIDVEFSNFNYHGIFCDASTFTDWIFEKCKFYNNTSSHLKCGGTWKECKIYNTLFDTCGSVGMYFSTGYVQDFLLKDSSVINSSNLGIYLYDNCNNVTIENTVIARNGYGSESEACGIKFSAHASTSVESIYIIGCTFDRNGTGQATFDDSHSGTGLIMKASGVDSYVSDVLIEDCKFIRNKHAAIRGYAKSDAVMSDNIVVQNCEFINNGYGVHTLYAASPAATIDAQYNYWNADDGPGDQGSGHGDSVTGGVTFSNYLQNKVLNTDYFDANTILAANADNTPIAVEVAEQRILGRITSGNIDDLTGTQVKEILDIQGSDVEIDKIGSPTYTNIQELINNTQSSMYINGTDHITENSALNGTIDISTVIGYIKISDSPIASIKAFEISGTTGMSLDTGINYIYIDYNSGTPIFGHKTTPPNHTTEIVLGKVYKESGTNYLHILNGGQNFADFKDKLLQSMSQVWGMQRATGLEPSESELIDRGINITSGTLYQAINDFTINSFDTGSYYTITGGGSGGTISANNTIVLDSGEGDVTDKFLFSKKIRIHSSSNGNDGVYTIYSSSWDETNTTIVIVETSLNTGDDTGHVHSNVFTSWYYNGASWVSVEGGFQIDNTQYNNVASGLVALTVNRYGVHWIYVDHDGHVHHVYGQGDYTLAGAEEATSPSALPSLVTNFCLLCAKIIIQKSSSSFESIVSAWTQRFAAGSVYNHNDLGDLQGGTAGEYYHLTSSEYSNAQDCVTKTTFDANTILSADSDNTPVALAVPEQTLIGRITSGVIDALTPTEIRTLINVEDGADVTDSTNVDAAGATMNIDTDVSSNSWVIDEDDMVSDLDTKVPTQQSVKKYVDDNVIGLFEDKGNYDASTNTPDLDVSPSGILKGDVYTTSVAGDFFTQAVEVGDVLRALQDDPTQLSHWAITQTNLDAPSIKTLYESNSDTNAFTDAEKTLLGNQSGTNTGDEVSATDSIEGIVELATIAEIDTGTDESRVITPAGLAGSALQSKVDGIEENADVTDSSNVDSSGAVMETDYNANTILAATSDDTPLPLTIPEQTLVGRITSGDIDALTVSEAQTLLNVEDGADVTDATNVASALGSISVNAHSDITSAGATIEATVSASHSQNTDTQLDSGEVTVDADDCVKINETLYFDAEYDNGSSGSAKTVNWKLGNKQKITLTADCTFTFTAPSGACNLILRLIQDTTAGWDATWPAAVIWLGDEPTWADGGNSKSIIAAFYFDGTNYWSQGSPWQV